MYDNFQLIMHLYEAMCVAVFWIASGVNSGDTL